MSKIVTNFGDSTTTGNTTLQQNLTVQGTQSVVYGNILAGSAFSTLGNSTTKFNTIYATTQNSTTLNTSSVYGATGTVGINTSASGAALWVAGNVWASNALSAPNVFATTSMNVALTMNVANIYGPLGVIGIGTTPVTGSATLQIQGNLWASNAISTPNILATVSMNAATSNTANLYSPLGVIGVGTTPVSGGAALQVQGNVWASNAISAPNVLATASMNAVTTNTASIYGTSGFVGVNTVGAAAALSVQGNVWASNAIVAPTVTACVSMNSTTINTTAIYGTSGSVGVGGTGTGATLNVIGNVYVSNALTAPQILVTNSNVAVLNVVTLVGQAGTVGVFTSATDATLSVNGNIWASNAVTAPNAIVTTLNVATVLNTQSIFSATNLLGIGTSAPAANLHVQGNVYASNALSAPTVYTTLANSTTLNVLAVYGQAGFVGVGGAGSGATLNVIGNVWASNALTAPVINVGTLNTSTTNTQSIYGPAFLVGIGTIPVNANLDVSGNIFASNALQAPAIYTGTANISIVNVNSIYSRTSGGVGINSDPAGAAMGVWGNLWASNAIQTQNVVVTNFNAAVINATSIYAPTYLGVGVGTSPLGANLSVWGNIFASNALQTPSINTPFINLATLNATTIFSTTSSGIGVNTTAPLGATLGVIGNVYASNALQTTNIIAPSVNTTTVNVVSIFSATVNGVAVNTTSNLGAILGVSGNVYASNAFQSTTLITTRSNVTTLNATSVYATTSSGVGVNTATGYGASLGVFGNVYVSNALQTPSVYVTSFNVLSINANSVFSRSANGISVNTTSNLGATLGVSGNVYASNALQTPTIYTGTANITTINAASIYPTTRNGVAISSTSNLGATLSVSGNLWVSNALQVQTIISPQVNVTTLNTTAVFATGSAGIGVNTTSGLGATLGVIGNLYASNALQTPSAYATQANVATLNANFIFNTTGNGISFNTTSNLGATVGVEGNVWASNALTGTNLVVAGSLYYNEDLFKRGPYLKPDTSNSALIQAWISATCNAASQPTKSWWATSARPTYGNVQVGAVSGDSFGGTLLPDGRVIFAPQNSNVNFFNPFTSTFSSVSVPAIGLAGFNTGVLLPNGSVFFSPSSAAGNCLVFNPSAFTTTNVNVGSAVGRYACLDTNANVFVQSGPNSITYSYTTGVFTNVTNQTGQTGTGCVPLPTGNIVVVPAGSTMNVLMFSPTTQVTANLPGTVFQSGTGNKFRGGVLAPNGNVVLVGFSVANTVVLNPSPTAPTWTNLVSVASYHGGCLLPSGNVILAPSASANIGMVDPAALTFSNCVTVAAPSSSLFRQPVLVPDGRVIFAPQSSNIGILNTMVTAPPEFCLSPYFNKF